MTIVFLAGPISNPKKKNCYSGIQGLAWTWGGEGGWNLMKSWVFEPGVRGYVFLIWGWDGLGGIEIRPWPPWLWNLNHIKKQGHIVIEQVCCFYKSFSFSFLSFFFFLLLLLILAGYWLGYWKGRGPISQRSLHSSFCWLGPAHLDSGVESQTPGKRDLLKKNLVYQQENAFRAACFKSSFWLGGYLGIICWGS